MAENNDYWDELLGALGTYFASRGSSGDTPNFYPVPMTPEDKAWNDRRMALYDSGGSQQMKAVGSAAQQFFGGMPTTASPTFASPMMRGQAFAGGIQLPRIDLSKFDFGAAPPGAGIRPGGNDPGTAGGEPGAEEPRWPTGGGPNAGGPDTRGADEYYGGRFPGMGYDDLPITGDSATDSALGKWWDNYKRSNPDWKMDGVEKALKIAAGIFGGPLATKLVDWAFGRRTQVQPLPVAGNRPTNDFPTGPGTNRGGYDPADGGGSGNGYDPFGGYEAPPGSFFGSNPGRNNRGPGDTFDVFGGGFGGSDSNGGYGGGSFGGSNNPWGDIGTSNLKTQPSRPAQPVQQPVRTEQTITDALTEWRRRRGA